MKTAPSAKPLLSVIIPTHNRQHSLERLLKNLSQLNEDVPFEVIVVDNNSSDGTEAVVRSFGETVRHVFEKNTSFTRARDTGAKAAEGEILLYLDDDVEVHPGTLSEIQRVFAEDSFCAVAGGKIIAEFEASPPEWTLRLQEAFNGWSLFDLGEEAIETHAVPGPLMAIRKSAYEAVGGFPPDTIGVETNKGRKTFRKLYIGPGDYGFCSLCTAKGYRVLYRPKIKVTHYIPPVRLTVDFWLSRLIGEAHYHAITSKQMSELAFLGERKLLDITKKLLQTKWKAYKARRIDKETPLLPEEAWLAYYKARLGMELVLLLNPSLSAHIWELGKQGVSDNSFDKVLQTLPSAYQRLALT